MAVSKVFVTLFAFCFIYSSDAVGQGAVRLVRYNQPTTTQAWSAGIVQIYWNGVWGNICDDYNFGFYEADVVCRQLGYNGVNSYSSTGTTTSYGTDTAATILQNVDCGYSDYLTVSQCTFTVSSGSSGSCGDDNDVVVICNTERIWDYIPLTGDIRLTGGTYSNEGLLAVYCNDEWGTVCDSTFTDTTATVACRQLGYNSYRSYNHLSLTGDSSQEVWLDNLDNGGCTASSTCLTTCQGCPFSEGSGCSHSKDVTLECEYDASADATYADGFDFCYNVDYSGLSRVIIIVIIVSCVVVCAIFVLLATVPLCVCCCIGVGVGAATRSTPTTTVVAGPAHQPQFQPQFQPVPTVYQPVPSNAFSQGGSTKF